MSESDAPAADWYTDPSGRFQFRYWDGETWTGHVSTDGKTDWDPPGDGAESGGAEAAGAATADSGAAAADTAAATVDADDNAWAPSADAAAVEVEPVATPEPVTEEPAPVEAAADDAAATELAAVAEDAVAEDGVADEASLAEDEPGDTNLVANRRAGIADDVVEWLDEVAAQVEPRLSRITQDWTAEPQAEAARACAYGLLVGHLARLHPHMRQELGQVAESHPSFSTLQAGSRLDTLEQIAGDPERAAAWLGPLIGAEDPQRVSTLFD